MQVEFGIWDHFERRDGQPVEEQYREKIHLLQEAERLGFYGYHLAEHHLSQLDLAPSPNVFLGALAMATSTLHIGTMVYIFPMYHPVRLAQELVMLDHMSGGRLQIGVGRGARMVEHSWAGLDSLESRARTEEVLEIIVKGFTTGNLSYQGKHYEIPDAPMDLLPVQKPYPPIWYAGGTEFAGRHALNFMTRNASEVNRYWDIRDQTRGPDQLNAHIEVPLAGVTKHMVVRETDEEAIAVARRAWPAFVRNWNSTSLMGPDMKLSRPQPDNFDEVLAENSRVLVGSPATVRAFMDQNIAELKGRPSFYFAPAFQWGDLTTEESLESIRLFATEVMPAYRSAPVAV